MGTVAVEDQLKAPYISWKTFASFVEEMREHLPTTIDASILRQGRSGSAATYLSLTLRFLRLVDDNEHPTEAFKLYLASKPENRPAVLREILTAAYADHLDLDSLANMSSEKLDDAIREFGNRGSIVDKGRKFFLEAAKAADVTLSRYIERKVRTYTRRPGSGRSRRRGETAGDEGGLSLRVSGTGTVSGGVLKPIEEQIREREVALLRRVLDRYKERPNGLEDWLEGMLQAREG